MTVTLETSRGHIECAVCGQGPAVLLLHGAMGGWDQGQLLARTALGSSGFQCIAVSRPGYLGTPLASGETPEQQADLCAAALDELKLRDAAVIAISGGGQCALQFALRHPDRCRRLVMISACSAPINVPVAFRFYLLKLMVRFPALAGAIRKKPALTLSDPEAGPLMLALQSSTMERMAERLPGTENDIRQSRLPFAYPLERISSPLLAIHGTADEAAPFAQARALAARVPGAELLAIKGGTHVVLFTHLHEIRARVMQFLGCDQNPIATHNAATSPMLSPRAAGTISQAAALGASASRRIT